MVNFGSGFIIVNLSWAQLRGFIVSKNMRLQHEEADDHYDVFAIDEPIVYVTTMSKDDGPDVVDFEENFKALSNKALNPRNEDGLPMHTSEPRSGNEIIIVTHNFADKTTWYTDSARVTEMLVDSGDGLTWISNHTHWIDMDHGKIFDEESIKQNVPHQYSVVVVVDGVTASMRDPYATSGGDYVVDYVNGSITCVSGTWSGKTVEATYSYAQSSLWTLTVDPGVQIDIEQAKAQFSTDIQMNDSIEFEIWAYNPYDFPNRVKVNSISYKRFTNFIDEAVGSCPAIPPIGGKDRGTQNAVYNLQFRYGTIRRMMGSLGIQLRVRLKNDNAFGGEHATATFYCTVRNEESVNQATSFLASNDVYMK
jgi:hypothetical protein